MSQFPSLYEDGRIRVFTNGSGEIFVQDKAEYGETMRISPAYRGLIVTCQGGLMTPTSKNGLDAFRVWSLNKRQ